MSPARNESTDEGVAGRPRISRPAEQCPSRATRESLNATATFRGTHLVPLSEAIRELVSLRSATYTAYRRSLGADGDLLPERFTDVVEAVVTFADLLTDEADGAARWNPELRRWEPS